RLRVNFLRRWCGIGQSRKCEYLMLVRPQATNQRPADRTGDQNSHPTSLSARFAAPRSEAQSCSAASTQRIEPPVLLCQNPLRIPINCRAASRSLVVDRGLGAVSGDDPGDQPRRLGLARIGADEVVGVGRLDPALSGAVDAEGLALDLGADSARDDIGED